MHVTKRKCAFFFS